MAMLLPAPGRFSMTKGCPRRSVSHWPIRRAEMSVGPPGVKPTLTRTGRVGEPCDHPRRDAAGSAAAPAASCRNRRRPGFMMVPAIGLAARSGLERGGQDSPQNARRHQILDRVMDLPVPGLHALADEPDVIDVAENPAHHAD